MRWMRNRTISVRHKVRIWNRLAQLLPASKPAKRWRESGQQLIHSPNRGFLQRLRRSPRSCVRGWTGAYRAPLLHKLDCSRFQEAGQKTGLKVHLSLASSLGLIRSFVITPGKVRVRECRVTVSVLPEKRAIRG